MSEDESGDDAEHTSRDQIGYKVNEDGQKQYRVLRYDWRNDPVITPILRIIDLITLSRKFGKSGRPARGNWTHVRLPSARTSARHALLFCPENIYLPSYVDGLTPHQKEHLEMKEPLPIPKITQSLKKYVLYFRKC